MKRLLSSYLLSMMVGILFAQTFDFESDHYTYGGFPKQTDTLSQVLVLPNEAYVSGYSESTKNPSWVCYRLVNQAKRDTCHKGERRSSFLIDKRTDSRIKHGDYTHSGYDRGHMAPNAAILCWYGVEAQRETYYMTNVVPQLPELNQHIWEHLEAKIRTVLSKDDSLKRKGYDLYITTGPIFNSASPDTLNSGVSIPDSFYKIIVFRKGKWAATKSIALIIPHEGPFSELDTYITNVDEIEELAGLDFFPNLSDWRQKKLETRKRSFKMKVISP